MEGLSVARSIIASWRSQKPDRQHSSVGSERFRYIRYANGKEELYDHKMTHTNGII